MFSEIKYKTAILSYDENSPAASIGWGVFVSIIWGR
jgi:hypothetical protein